MAHQDRASADASRFEPFRVETPSIGARRGRRSLTARNDGSPRLKIVQCGMMPGKTYCCKATSTPSARVGTTLCQKVRAKTTRSCPHRSVPDTPVAIFSGRSARRHHPGRREVEEKPDHDQIHQQDKCPAHIVPDDRPFIAHKSAGRNTHARRLGRDRLADLRSHRIQCRQQQRWECPTACPPPPGTRRT